MRELEDWISAWEHYTENIESPHIYSEWVAISLIASALSRKVALMWDRRLFPNFYIFLVGPPAALKGTALNPASKFLADLNLKLAPNSLTRRRFLTVLERPPKDEGLIKQAVDPISELTIHSSELTVFLNKNNMQLISDLTDLFDYDRDDWSYETESAGSAKIHKPFVNIIGGVQPQLLTTILPEEAHTMGFMSRVIVVYADRKDKEIIFPQEVKIPKNLEGKLLHDLKEIRGMKGWFSIDESFKRAYAEWHKIRDEEVKIYEERLQYYIERRRTHILKLCMIMNASRRNGNMTITAKDFHRAHASLRKIEKVMNKAFVGMSKLDDAEVLNAVLAYIVRTGGTKYSELLRRYWKDIDEVRLSTVIATWEKMGEIECIPVSGNAKDFIIKITGGDNYD